MALAFGTSGLRGLVTELDNATVAAWVRAYLVACPPLSGPLYVGRDLRPSSPRIAEAALAAAEAAGMKTVDCGVLPTPALALAAKGAAAVMVTGSHIPADRNGLKFYRADGEIRKQDEVAIMAALMADDAPRPAPAAARRVHDAISLYVHRYLAAFGPGALAGLRVGLWQHSSAARDLLAEVMTGLGAEVVQLDRSEDFVPVDTEAVDPTARAHIQGWCATHRFDALVSTDADADRPVLADATGTLIAGDILGVLTARWLNAEVVVTPISSNSMVRTVFPNTRLTQIGSPFVLVEIAAVLAHNPAARVVGFEPNGGFLLGFAAQCPAGLLAPLLTRDALLPLIAPLAAAREAGKSIRDLVQELPNRVTATDRLQGIAADVARTFLGRLDRAREARADFLAGLGNEAEISRVDGLRMQLVGGAILHLRPSGNAPEFRVYAEADSLADAQALLGAALQRLETALR